MTQDNILIRDFQITDVNSLTDLTGELGYATTVEQMTTRMERILQLENYRTFVAVFDNIIVVYIGLNKNYFWEQDGCFVRIQALVVHTDYRRLGVGQKLIDAAENFARETDAKLIVLNCGNREERGAAHKFYPEMGFEPRSTGYVKRLD